MSDKFEPTHLLEVRLVGDRGENIDPSVALPVPSCPGYVMQVPASRLRPYTPPALPPMPSPDDTEAWDHKERRAWFVYEAARLQAIAVDAPVVPEPWANRDEAFRAQFVEVIDRQMGPMRSGSPEEMHGGWVQAYIDMGWTYGPERDPDAKKHPDMVPFAALERREQDKDAVFLALCEIARLWILAVEGYEGWGK